VDGNLNVSISGTVDTAKLGIYTLTYTASDLSGNSVKVTRTLRVIDTTPPVISLTGGAEIIHSLGKVYEDEGATALDNVDGVVSVTTVGSVNTSVQGDYTLTYSAIDQAGNEADPVTRTVKVQSFDANLGLLTFAINSTNDSLSLISCDVSASGGVEVPAVWDGKPVTGIGEGAFAGCSQVVSVLLPEDISTIGDGAFAGCVLLTEVSLPASLDSLGDGLFAQCEALESIRFLGDAPDLVAGGALADDASAAVVYVEALASGFGTLFGGL